MTPTEYWHRNEIALGHIKPSVADVIEWVGCVAWPASAFIAYGSIWWLIVAFIFAGYLIPQWGVPTDLRWNEDD